ncbi:MAG TPA: hypothetical protein VIF62_03620 [Labilithrix sp.]
MKTYATGRIVSVALAAFAVACSGAPKDNGGADYEITNPTTPAASATSTGDDGSQPPVTQDATPPAADDDAGTASVGTESMYEGTLAATSAVPFGGSPYCKYSVTLKTVLIDAKFKDDGSFESVTVHDVMNEAVVGSCPYTAQPASNQTFTSSGATLAAGNYTVAFTGGKDNRPATKLVVDLVKSDAGWTANATWTRTDQPAPLGWTVKASLPLGKK